MNPLALSALLATVAFAQYKVEPAGAPPPEVSALASALSKDGTKVLKDDGSPLCEIWLVSAVPTGGTPEQNTTFPNVPQGALMGVVRYPARARDRRGQTIQPGVYTLRYSRFPMNGDHMGVEPQRDFFLLSPAASDTDPAAKPDFDTLVGMSKKASGTPHPLVLSIWKDDADAQAGIEDSGDSDKILHTTMGGTKVAIIVVGVHQG
jgi:hypothetical protein